MLDFFTIFTVGGLVLWSQEWTKLRGNPINELIKKVFLELLTDYQSREGTDTFDDGAYTLKWVRDNESGLFFVAVFQKIVRKVAYIDILLEVVKKKFISQFGTEVRASALGANCSPFGKKFESMLKKSQEEADEREAQVKAPRNFYQTKKGQQLAATTSKGKEEAEKEKEREEERKKKEEEKEREEREKEEVVGSPLSGSPTGRAGPGKFGSRRGVSSPKSSDKEPAPGSKRTKQKQNWNKEEKTSDVPLNYGEDASARQYNTEDVFGSRETIRLSFSSSSSESSSEEEEKPSQKPGLFSFFSSITNKELTASDLDPVLAQFKTSLVSKNVAQEISEQLCESVKMNLVGKKLGTFSKVTTAVQESMEESLTRILTPKRSIDMLRDIRLARAEGRPYVTVFVGVNGVGKSTSLAKVCSWLLQNNLKVLIAACDTFRSGAIEQLEVHCKNLGVELYSRGYGKHGKEDATSVAQQAIRKGKEEGYDVVLVDTSGRMQGNVKLMKELAVLVGTNNPDLVLFVGEALAGNDSVDQLTLFNKALQDFSVQKEVRGIDGIILTKFDTVDEKVGTAISMVYSTGQPIVFVGVGQKYTDLRVLDVHKIVSILKK